MTDPGKVGRAVAKATEAERMVRSIALHAEARALYDQADHVRMLNLAMAAQGTADWYTALLKVRALQEEARALEAPL